MGIVMESSEVNLVGANCLSIEPDLFGTMSAPSEYYETLHTIAINTRDTEFGSYVEPIPITLKAYNHIPALTPTNGYSFPHSVITPLHPVLRVEPERATTSVIIQSPVKEDKPKVARPPKKKWIKEYLEEEPELPVSVRVAEAPVSRSNGVVRPPSPPPPAILDFAQEHSRPRTNGSHGPTQIPSPPSVGSNGSSNGSNSSSSNGSSSGSNGIPRAGTREVHNKLEKNRRAHLKECFEMLKRQLPATPDDKKTSNLSILGSAIRYIQVLRRKERECEHEMERLAREKIAAQQRLAALKREVTIRAAAVRPRGFNGAEDKEREENIVNGQVLGIPISINCSPPRETSRADTPPPRTLNLSTKLRTLPIQISPTTSQVVGSGGLMVSPAAIQLLSTGGGLRVLQTNGVATESSRLSKENGVSASAAVTTEGSSVVVSGLTPLVVSQSTAHLLHTHTHTITQKMVESGMVKNGVPPLAVSAQYLTATTIVKPVVVVTSAHSPAT
ncbi:max-binding protein MNT-like isoform X4 [Pieris brassicae]|uniref:max-binding protein MNT-like isoform X4 n=1 Tax=Pieris brassicae TaxID=7116 RepID=UPI001E65FFF2|nr:max-binding protein MNT-like isoform X4 [Pieris brassicae]